MNYKVNAELKRLILRWLMQKYVSRDEFYNIEQSLEKLNEDE